MPNSVHFELLSETKDWDSGFIMIEGKLDKSLCLMCAPLCSDRGFYRKIEQNILHNGKLIKEISIEDIDRAISSLKSCKSPGTDGFPGEWYKSMMEQRLPVLRKSFNYTFREGVTKHKLQCLILPKHQTLKTNTSLTGALRLLNTLE